MKPLAFNLRDAKKIATDGKTSTFQVGKGHEIRILHSAIPALQRKQMERMPLCKGGEISKMADGGDVLPKYMKSPKNPKMEAVGTGGVAMAEGGKAEQIDLSEPNTSMTVPKTARDDAQKQMKDDQTWQKPADDSGTIKAGEYKMYAEGTPGQPVSDQDMAPQEPVQDVQPPEVAPPSPQEAQVPMTAEPTTTMAETNATPQVANIPVNTNVLNPNGTTNAPAAVTLQQQAAREQQAVDTSKGQSVATIEDAYNKQRALIAQRDQNNFNELKRHTDEFKQYMTVNPINPNHYMESMGIGRKVSTAIGLFLGGLGGGIAHTGGNVALDYLNNQISRDIDAQKARADQQKTIFGAYKDLYGDANIATNLTKVSLNDIYSHKMQMTAAQLGTAQAKAAADAFTSAKALENTELLRNTTNDAALNRKGGTRINGQPPMPVQGDQKPAGGRSANTPSGMGAADPKWGDEKLKVGSSVAPKTNPPEQIKINYDRFKESQQLGTKGVPGEISPAEVGEANHAIDYVNTMNQVVREIHKQFPEMWKHGAHATPLTTGLDDAHAFGVTIPNPGAAFPGMKEYFTASSAIKKQLGNLIKGGLSPEVSELIQKQLVNTNDTPAQYRDKLQTIEGLLRQSAPVAVLKKYHLADGLPE